MNNTFSEVRVKPAVKFHWAFLAAGFMHIAFLTVFAIWGLYLMMQIEVVSVCLYIFGAIMSKKKVSERAFTWTIVFFAEVLIHAVICTMIQGIEVCFFLYPLMCMPIYGYLLFAFCDKQLLVRTSLFMAITTLVVGIMVFLFVDNVGTVYTLTDMREFTDSNILVLRGINVSFATAMLMVFTVAFYMELMKVLTMLQDSNKKLGFTATHDALTGLSNRHSLWKFFEELEKSGDEYCIFMGDLDDFKRINDTYGHDCGDKVLKAVADIMLKQTDRTKDIACRWGGEEMLVVMRGDRETSLKRVREIKDMISGMDIVENGSSVKVSMTFGFVGGAEIATFRDKTDEIRDEDDAPLQHDIDNLISIVDKRLYVGKRSGKNVIIAA